MGRDVLIQRRHPHRDIIPPQPQRRKPNALPERDLSPRVSPPRHQHQTWRHRRLENAHNKPHRQRRAVRPTLRQH